MPEGCRRSKRSLNWPPILLYKLIQLVQTTNEEKKTKNIGYKGVTCRTKQTESLPNRYSVL